MKITKNQLKRLIKEERRKLLKEELEEPISYEERGRFQDAYKIVEDAVSAGTLPESVEDAFHDMLHLLGIYV